MKLQMILHISVKVVLTVNNTNEVRKFILRDCRREMYCSTIIIVLCNLLSGFISIYMTERVGLLTDSVFNSNLSSGIDKIIELLMCIVISVIIIPLVCLKGYIYMISSSLKHNKRVLSRFLDKSYEDVHRIDLGEISYRLEDDLIDMRNTWVMITERVYSMPILFAFVLYNTIKIDLTYTIIVLIASCIKIVLPILIRTLEAKYDKEEKNYKEKLKAFEISIFDRPYDIQFLGITNRLIERINSIYKQYYQKTHRKNLKLLSVTDTVSEYLDTSCFVVILIVGAYLVSIGELTAGAVAAMVGYFYIYNKCISDIGFIIRKRPILTNAITRLTLIYDGSEKKFGYKLDDVVQITGKGLSYAYDDNTVLDNIDFVINKGSKTAVIGPNGSGKSTLLKLICGLNTRYAGSLSLNGIEMSNADKKTWQRQFSYVEQDLYLFDDTVKNNIRLGNVHASDKVIDSLLDAMGILYLAERKASADQNDLSGGEKQKIAIARAIIKDAEYIIMDEPSNNLDEKTLKWLQEFIASSKKTIIFVTHDDKI